MTARFQHELLQQAANSAQRVPFAGCDTEEIYGCTVTQLARAGSSIAELTHPDDLERLNDGIRRAHETMTSWHHEFRLRHPTKGEIWVEGRSAPIRTEDGSAVWHGFLTDITPRKQAEEALHLSKAHLITALESGGMGTWIWDVRKDRVSRDISTVKLIGRPADDPMESLEQALRAVHADDRPKVQAAFEACRQGGPDYRTEFRVPQPDGSMRWFISRGRLEHDDAGHPWRVTGVLLDITDRRRAEEAQIRSQKMEALGTLAGGIAHDFNNILLAISGNARLARTDASDLPPDHPLPRNLSEIERATARAADLVRRILTFSRQGEPTREVMSLQPIVDETLELLHSTLPAMIRIRSRFEPDVPPVCVDATQMHQIMLNLITNAAHAVDESNGLIEVTLDSVMVGADATRAEPAELCEGRYVRIAVSDNGCGMDKATLERIFDPFFTTRPPGQGTGLGLSVVHGIVRNHDGAIAVHSEPGAGTCFRLYLPAATNHTANNPRQAREAPMGRRERVLYVDDEDSLVFLTSRVLERLGYQVTGFTDPREALQAFTAAPGDFDVVVTDLSMPCMSGFALARDIHALRPDIPILLTSGYVRAEDRETARQRGIREIVLKPDTIDELGHTLDRIFRTCRGEVAADR
ncbi:MAG TPA: PAS domain-containing protein [Povalibacter sp.]|nr:PAS domain-containing protein [Povalibacter sp.]